LLGGVPKWVAKVDQGFKALHLIQFFPFMTTDSTEIFVLDQKIRLLQPQNGFRTSLDSVMVAAACPAKENDRVLDMGCGVGGASFCLLHRVPDCHVTGIEIQQGYAALAVQNIALNKAEGRAAFINADVLDFMPEKRFDHILCNPPYLEAGTHSVSPDVGKSIALGHLHPPPNILPPRRAGGNQESGGRNGLQSWLDAAFRCLKSNGSLTLIHRADAVDKIILGLGKRFGAIEIIPLYPHAGEAAKRVIVRAMKDRRSPATLHAGLVLHEADGRYTEAAEAVLRDGKGLF
jgi:tRNA1(Val) A37 N6-methylase TrmN6